MTPDAKSTRLPQWQLYLPLYAWLAYSLTTIACYALGPYTFSRSDSAQLYVYLAAIHAAIVFGYWRAARARPAIVPGMRPAVARDLKKFLKPMGWLALASVSLAVISNVAAGMTVEAGLSDPAAVRQAWIEAGGSPLMHMVVTFSVAVYPYIMMVAAHWSAVGRSDRIVALLVCAGIVASGVQTGSRAGIFGMLAVVLAGAACASAAQRAPWRLRQVGAGLLAVALVFALYASFIAINRADRRIDDYGAFIKGQNDFPVDPSHPIFDLVPGPIAPAVLSGIFYFGHGYEGLAIALEKPFIGTALGFGHSAVLVRTLESTFGVRDIADLSYFYRLNKEDGYSSSLWVTIYPWIASDVTFPGSVLFMAVMGWWCSLAWSDVISGRSVAATWALAWIVSTIASTSGTFPPGDYGAFISFWGSLAAWLMTRRADWSWR